MKKIFTLVIALTTSAALNAQTQIGNAGFENWENVSGGSEPVNWNSFLTASGGLNGQAANQLQESTDVRPGSSGSKSVRLNSRSVLGIVANGNVTLGQINMGSVSPSNSSNHNISRISNPAHSEAFTDHPDSIVFWVKFTPNGHNENARMKATIHDNYEYRDPEDANSTSHVYGVAQLNFASTSGQWVRKSIPFTYPGPATTANFMLITFTTNQTPGGGANNDYLWVDDVELIYNQPSFTASAPTVCAGQSVTFTNTSALTGTSYEWSFPGGTPSSSTAQNPPAVTYATPGNYDVTLTIINAWGNRTTTVTNQVAVNANPNPAFTYAQATYCSNVSNPIPTTSASGTFTASPAGLNFANATTGEINLAASTAGTYTITHTTPGSCGSSTTANLTVFLGADASFSFPTNTICILSGDQTPTVTNGGGTFSAEPTGLTFGNATTGEIDVDGSTPGTYAVSYVIGGGCPDTVTVNITLTDTPDATFNYQQAAYCLNGTNPSPVYGVGANAGVFSSTAGLSINANTGVINLAASTPGSYTVTNNIAANGACAAATDDFNITINALPVVAFTLVDDSVCISGGSFLLTGGTPAGGTYSGTGVLSNIFNPSVSGQGSSTVITYSYTNPTTTCSNTATDIIAVVSCLSVDEADEMESITVFPNPTKGALTVANVNGTANYTIISLTGKIVERGEVTNTTTIDVSTIENGVYLLQMEQGQNIKTIRFVKQ